MEMLTKLLEKRGAARWLLVAVVLVCGACLLLPAEAVDRLRLAKLLERYGEIMGMAFLCSSVLLVVDLLFEAVGFARQRFAWEAQSERRRKRSLVLCQAEQSVLREFALQQRNTIFLPIDDPAVAGLIRSGILVVVGRAGHRARVGSLFPVAIADEYSEHLTPAALGLPCTAPTPEDIDHILSKRPDFAVGLHHDTRRRLSAWVM